MSARSRTRRTHTCGIDLLEPRQLLAVNPADNHELTVLLRGQSNALLWGNTYYDIWTVWGQVQQALGYDGTNYKINIISDSGRSDGKNTLNSGTAFIGDWVAPSGSSWTNLALENGILDDIRSQPANVKAAPAAVIWMHSEYDSTNQNLTTDQWVSAVRYDAAQVRAAFGGDASRIPYIFVNALPYNNARSDTNQAIKIGMQQLADDPTFNAKVGAQFYDVDFSAWNNPYGDGDHMGGSHLTDVDGDILNPRVSTLLEDTFADYALSGSPLANAGRHVDQLGPQVIQASTISGNANQLLLTIAHDSATGLQSLNSYAAAGIGWSLNGSGQWISATGATVVDSTHIRLTFGQAVPTNGSVKLYYTYGGGRLAYGEDASHPFGYSGHSNALYDNNGMPIWTIATGVAINAAAQSPYKDRVSGIAGGAIVNPTLPTGWSAADIGSPSRAGSSSYNSSTSTWTVAGSGADIWSAPDQFQFASTAASGDTTMVARVTSVTNTDSWAKSGIMFRDGTGASASYVDVVLTAGNGGAFQYRDGAGTPVHTGVTGIGAGAWVKLVRSGSTFTGYYAITSGTPAAADWQQIGSTTMTFPTSFRAGLAVTSHNNSATNTSTFTNVSVGQVTGATPYFGSPFVIATTSATRIEAEDYDKGGQGIAYSDSEATNYGGGYRAGDGVDMRTGPNASNSYQVGWTAAGEWLAYSLNVNQAGRYDITLRMASGASGGRAHLEFGPIGQIGGSGTTSTAAFTVGSTGSWDVFTDVKLTGIQLSAGQQWMRLVEETDGFDLDSIIFSPGATTPAKLSGTAIGTPGSWNNTGMTIDKVFDGDLNTFFDPPTNVALANQWVGLDLGSARTITSIKVAPVAGFANRMVNAQIQVSNTADFSSGVQTVYTFAWAPSEGRLTQFDLNVSGSYRYIRYIGGTEWCNISEMEVYGN